MSCGAPPPERPRRASTRRPPWSAGLRTSARTTGRCGRWTLPPAPRFGTIRSAPWACGPAPPSRKGPCTSDRGNRRSSHTTPRRRPRLVSLPRPSGSEHAIGWGWQGLRRNRCRHGRRVERGHRRDPMVIVGVAAIDGRGGPFVPSGVRRSDLRGDGRNDADKRRRGGLRRENRCGRLAGRLRRRLFDVLAGHRERGATARSTRSGPANSLGSGYGRAT